MQACISLDGSLFLQGRVLGILSKVDIKGFIKALRDEVRRTSDIISLYIEEFPQAMTVFSGFFRVDLNSGVLFLQSDWQFDWVHCGPTYR